MKNVNSTKAQSEIMGLAIIMILIALGILFAIVFFTGSSEKGFTQITEHELVSNTLNSILQTTTDCEGQTVEMLIRDCEGEKRFWCAGNELSCDYVKKQIKDMLTKTLGAQNRDYNFQISGTQELREKFGKKCTEEQTTSTSPIVFYGGSLEARLELCR